MAGSTTSAVVGSEGHLACGFPWGRVATTVIPALRNAESILTLTAKEGHVPVLVAVKMDFLSPLPQFMDLPVQKNYPETWKLKMIL